MDLTPLVPPGRQVIERYGPTGFRVSGILHAGAILVFPERTLSWAVGAASSITPESLLPVVEHGDVEILLLGLGRRMGVAPSAVRAALRAAGIAIEPMDTGAACRTYGVLMAEDRRVAAALLPLL